MATNNDSLWQKTKTNSKAGFDRIWAAADKLGAPVNRLSNKLGSEAFWPTTLDKEADKAARILRSFCKDGFYKEEMKQTAEGPKAKQRVIQRIPTEVIKNAKGLAIFTTMRTGLWISGAGGSGIVIARKEDGSWSPPSGILLHTAGLGFLVGVDIYDCVLVLNTQEALDAFTKIRCTVGGEVSAVAGPVGAGGVLESEVHTRRSPIYTYLKSRGFYAGVQIDGSVIVERTDENERFYGTKLPAKRILAGDAYSPYSLRGLTATLKAAQGDSDVNEDDMPSAPPPADFEVVQDGHVFGIPDKEDPDPFGVAALSKEGLEVKDATTHTRAADTEFEFRPRQDSPAYAIINRADSGGMSPRNQTFGSPNHKRYGSSDHSTQTDFDARSQQGIQMEDKEIGRKDSLEDVSLSETPEKPVAKPPLPMRGPPPKLPPRNSVPVPSVESEPIQPEAVAKAPEIETSEHQAPKVEATETKAPVAEIIEPEAPVAKITEPEASVAKVSEPKAPETGNEESEVKNTPEATEPEATEPKATETPAAEDEAAEINNTDAKP